MHELEQVKELAAAMAANGVSSLEVKGDQYALRLVRTPGTAPASGAATGSRARKVQALSPAAGPFHNRGGDDGLAALERGAQVLAGEPLGYVGHGPVRIPCVAPETGTLVGRLPAQGQIVRKGEPLFTMETRA